MRSEYQDRIDQLNELIDSTEDVLELKAIQNELEDIIAHLNISLRDLDEKLKNLFITNQIKNITRMN